MLLVLFDGVVGGMRIAGGVVDSTAADVVVRGVVVTSCVFGSGVDTSVVVYAVITDLVADVDVAVGVFVVVVAVVVDIDIGCWWCCYCYLYYRQYRCWYDRRWCCCRCYCYLRLCWSS